MGRRGEGWTLAGLHYVIGKSLICYVSTLSTAQPLLLNILGPNLESLPKYPQPLPRRPCHPLLHTIFRQCASSLSFPKNPCHPLLNSHHRLKSLLQPRPFLSNNLHPFTMNPYPTNRFSIAGIKKGEFLLFGCPQRRGEKVRV